jgi:hypothetical protein
MVRTCGHLDCIPLNPAFAWRATGSPGSVLWFLRVVPDTGLILESIDTVANKDPGWMTDFRSRRVLRLHQPTRIGKMLDLSWDDGVATVQLRDLAGHPSPLWKSCASLPAVGPGTTIDLAGRWRLELVADTGRATGRSLSADLVLRPTTPAQRAGKSVITGKPVIDDGYAFWGTLSTDLRRLGALPSGHLTSNDPAVPGVRVYVRRERPGTEPFLDLSIQLRAQPPYDHWETVLDGDFNGFQVQAMDRDMMAGTWESSGGEMAVSARGRFCGRRVR